MITVALATAVTTLPRGPGLAYEPKFDGHRLVVVRTPEEVVLQARSGRIVTAAFPDLAVAALQLPAATVLDGEVVVWHAGRTDFVLVQRRAAATAARAAVLAQSLPASYAAFDVLELAGLDLRARPYERRRALLVDLLLPLGPPLQPVPMTTDPELAETWYETLRESGVEGLVIKRLDQSYPAGRRGWQKLRHTNVRDAAVVGYTGPRRRPVALVLVLPVGDETPVVSSPLTAALRAEVAAAVAGREERAGGTGADGAGGAGGAGGEGGAGGVAGAGVTATAIGVGEVPFQPLDPPLTAEVRYTSARHPPPEVLRLRTDL
ncbi:ATP-dependent DNA ligase [Streptomyces sp. APSN-46.1]|uniref:ATP-dependent DNA ligase n=1 Tax=Streptomyces sp. APSN-46.1 TaxID=2929049 RepID=UPI001FB3FF98|nr:ATP-dependent DNA ligase [Streptomyces sp. APSN-46.1]MCJ1680766.1 ATP-dependent DNA ligase [Streptomyces sp. APSN-46.1]